jgi:hypothetical protein
MTYHNWGIYQNTGITDNSYDPYGFWFSFNEGRV